MLPFLLCPLRFFVGCLSFVTLSAHVNQLLLSLCLWLFSASCCGRVLLSFTTRAGTWEPVEDYVYGSEGSALRGPAGLRSETRQSKRALSSTPISMSLAVSSSFSPCLPTDSSLSSCLLSTSVSVGLVVLWPRCFGDDCTDSFRSSCPGRGAGTECYPGRTGFSDEAVGLTMCRQCAVGADVLRPARNCTPNEVLSSGTNLFQWVFERMTKDTTLTAPSTMKIMVVAPPNGKYLHWWRQTLPLCRSVADRGLSSSCCEQQ